ncbi:MAG: hypothetical protein ABJK20_11550 [Halieaceae bacterium]
MNSSGTLRARSAHPRARLFSVFALFCYVISSAIVPAGFMAAPLESGTAFHLCPGDARSAVLISKLAGEHGHHHHHQQSGDTAEVSVDSGCAFTGQASLATPEVQLASFDILQAVPPATLNAISTRYSYAWARPPARSPPA